MDGRRSARLTVPRLTLLTTFLATCLVSGTPAEAWPKQAYRSMVYDTMRMLPPRLARVLLARDEALLRGVSTLPAETASRLAADGRSGSLSPELIVDVENRIERVVQLLAEHRPLDEMALELGRLLRIAADISDPAVIGAGRPELRRMAGEYYRFVDLNLIKFPLVHDDGLSSPLQGAAVATLLREVAAATTASIPSLTEAFWSNGQLVPAHSFDYRSVPYAKTSLTYSRAVTAASYLWLAAWSKANGDFTGYRFDERKR